MKSITIDIDAPEDIPLDLALLKQDLRIAHDDLDEVIMQQYIPDAVSWAEGAMRRSIVAREHRWILDSFPCGADQTVYLPRGRVQSLTSIVYSSAGQLITLRGPSSGSPIGTDYQEDLRGHQGRVMPNRGGTWPSVDVDVPSPILITFTAGWNVEDVPADIKRALTASVFGAMELDGLLTTKSGFDADFREKLISAWRIL